MLLHVPLRWNLTLLTETSFTILPCCSIFICDTLYLVVWVWWNWRWLFVSTLKQNKDINLRYIWDNLTELDSCYTSALQQVVTSWGPITRHWSNWCKNLVSDEKTREEKQRYTFANLITELIMDRLVSPWQQAEMTIAWQLAAACCRLPKWWMLNSQERQKK